jgi:hypothetical protein
MSGIMPSRCAMNSSGSTVVLTVISTMSMAKGTCKLWNVSVYCQLTESWQVCHHDASERVGETVLVGMSFVAQLRPG